MAQDDLFEVCNIRERAYIRVTGADAEQFLHSQLSHNVKKTGRDTAALGGWHDARGRCLALFRLIAAEGSHVLVTDASVAHAAIEGLEKYVLRADVNLRIDDQWQGIAIVGDTSAALEALGVALGQDRNACTIVGNCAFVRLGPALVEIHGPADAIAALGLTASAPPALAELEQIALGVPRLPAAAAGRYVAQMLNLDRLGAVSFDKGCYPGQEVIARTHHLGAVKRRLSRFSLDAGHDVAPGSSIHDFEGEHAGEVVQSARLDNRHELLAVVRTSAIEDGLYLADGERSRLLDIPLPDGG